MSKDKCYSINSYYQVEKLINLKKNKREVLILYVKYYLVKGLGIDWLHTFILLVKKNYHNHKIKFYIDSGKDYGLSIQIFKENIDYLKIKSNNEIIKKIRQIAKKNKVLLNPDFNIVEVSKIKKI